MAVSWTNEQKRAITETGSDILVSAGAGSGKTAVMVNRIIRLVVEDRVPIKSMLVVTFTEASAQEMKNRIRKELKDVLSTSDVDTKKFLKEQISDLASANISTFHAFAKSVIDDFFYIVKIEPNPRVMDETERAVVLEDALDELFEREYEENKDDFIALLDAYTKPGYDTEARDMTKKIFGEAENLPGKYELIEEKADELILDEKKFMETEAYHFMIKEINAGLDSSLSGADNAIETVLQYDLIECAGLSGRDKDHIQELKDALNEQGYDAFVEELSDFKFERLPTNIDKEVKDSSERKELFKKLRDAYKQYVKDLQEDHKRSLSRELKMMAYTHGFAKTILRLAKELDDRFSRMKREKKVIDFSDMEHFALTILENEETREYYRRKFKYIFIDEYQDTSLMQETIISRIKSEGSLFMVGDVKQSIYKFRNADPGIFVKRYHEYAENMRSGDNGGIKIELNTNFRSRPWIIDSVNSLFRGSMKGYDEDAALKASPGKGMMPTEPPKTFVIDRSAVDDVSIDAPIQDYTKDMLEAEQVLRIVLDNHNKEYKDRDNGEVRRLKYRDMAILMSSYKSDADAYREVFLRAGVDLYLEDNQGYFDTFEISVFMSLLTLIDNKYDDIAFIAVLRSEIFGFGCGELARIRMACPKGSYVKAALFYAGWDGADPLLKQKLEHVFTSLARWREYARSYPLPELIWKLLMESGYYIAVGAMPGGVKRQANLRLLVVRAKDFASRSGNSLYGFKRYVDEVKKNDIKVSPATLTGENDDAVRLMTIHHSKGLEFPLVIVSGIDRDVAKDKSREVTFDRGIGFGISLTIPKYHVYDDVLIKRIIKKKTYEDRLDERMRLLYVAATRAEESLYFVGLVNDYRSFELKRDVKKRTLSFLDIMGRFPGETKVDAASLMVNSEEASEESKILRSIKKEEVGTTIAEDLLGYEYPHKEAAGLMAKTSVTGMNKMTSGDGEIERELAAPEERRKKRAVSATDLGTAYHDIMERIDFARASEEGKNYIAKFADELTERGIMAEEARSALDPGRIDAFFKSDLGRRCVTAYKRGELMREQTFELKRKMHGEDVLVQGIIDCCFVEDGEIVLIDYKTNRINKNKSKDEEKERLRKMYEKQIELYAEALGLGMLKSVKEAYLYLFVMGDSVKVDVKEA